MTTHYTKTDLENFIFARAARVHATVDGVRGELVSPAGDACLQVLICVYNAFFAADNRQFLQEESAPEPRFLAGVCGGVSSAAVGACVQGAVFWAGF